MLFVAAVFLSGCGTKDQAENQNVPETKKESLAESTKSGTCEKGKVTLEGYGDPGKRLANCFVEYPGEPSRQDKSYYIVEDTCGQFTKEFVENMLGQKLAKIELPKVSSINNCTYYFNDKDYVMLNLEYLKVENQKIGNEAMDRKVEKDSKIPMDNLVVYEEGGVVNVVYLILGPEKFISIRPSSVAATKIVNLIDFAAKVGEAIKDYK